MHSELALKIAREKLRLDGITTMHIDTTAGTLSFSQAFDKITVNFSQTNCSLKVLWNICQAARKFFILPPASLVRTNEV